MRLLSRAPWFSIVALGVIAGLEVATHFDAGLHDRLERWFAVTGPQIGAWQLHRLLLSPFIQANPGFVGSVLWLALAAVPLLELRTGTWRTIAVFLLGDVLSTLPILVVLRLAAEAGNAHAAALLIDPDAGSSSGAFACASAFALGLRGKRRWLVLAVLWGYLLVRVIGWHRLYDFQHALAALMGAALWLVFEQAIARTRTPRKTRCGATAQSPRTTQLD